MDAEVTDHISVWVQEINAGFSDHIALGAQQMTITRTEHDDDDNGEESHRLSGVTAHGSNGRESSKSYE